MDPREEITSTINRHGCPTASIASRTRSMRLVTPVDVSLCTTNKALYERARSLASVSSTTAGSTPLRQSPGTNSTSSPRRVATPHHCEAKNPWPNISTLSPADNVLTSPASHPPLPDAGNMITWPDVLKILRTPSIISLVSSANSGPRWSIVGRPMARSTRSGTLVGPGTWRKCRPP